MKNYKTNEEYKNEYNRQNYDRIGLMLPKGMGDQWKEEAKRRNLSLNAFIIDCVKKCTVEEKTVQFSENDEKP